ncbi:hypothetical protein HOLleu_36002 [Holothuria leucospilota]|uniref:Uncharacterized protein n=1 Tax=Holothuria leucospilota TaxID=206669 RepID=A0A9Q0YQP5_HOLLE|nr:hypothetical protein HOLleu_36002 [Holothuria leucospilota]
MTQNVYTVPLPTKLSLQGNLKKNWDKFKQLWDSYEIVTGLNEKEEKIRVAAFITCIGSEALEIHNALPYENEADRQKLSKILDLWEKYCVGKTNVIFERYKFHNCDQAISETFDEYIVKLRNLAKTCDFGPLKEEMIRDRIVCGITSRAVRKKLLQTADLDLEKCIIFVSC